MFDANLIGMQQLRQLSQQKIKASHASWAFLVLLHTQLPYVLYYHGDTHEGDPKNAKIAQQI